MTASWVIEGELDELDSVVTANALVKLGVGVGVGLEVGVELGVGVGVSCIGVGVGASQMDQVEGLRSLPPHESKSRDRKSVV